MAYFTATPALHWYVVMVTLLRAFTDDVTDVVTNGQVVCDSDAEHLDVSRYMYL